MLAHGYEVLYLTEDVDEFALQMLHAYDEKEFSNVCKDDLDLSSEEDKESLKEANEKAEKMFLFMKDSIGGQLHGVRFTNTLQNHAACLSSEGAVSANMEKVLSKNPGNEPEQIKAELVLEINLNHPIAEKLQKLYEEDQEKLAAYSKILYANARLVSGLSLENPAEVSQLVCGLMLD